MEKLIKIILFETRNNLNSLNALAGSINEKYEKNVEIHYCKSLKSLVDLRETYVGNNSLNLLFLSFTTVGFYEIKDNLRSLLRSDIGKNFIVVAGGAHPSACPQEILDTGIHFVCRGEGERFICDFIDFMLTEGDFHKLNRIRLQGLSYFEKNEFKDHGYAEQIKLDDYPPFNIKQKRFNAIEITRGCIYACSFCQTPFLFKAKFRHRSIDNICYYVEILCKHGLRDIRFITPSALSYGSDGKEPNLDKVEELLFKIRQIIGKNGRIFFGTFPSEIRPEHITPQSLQMLKRYVSNDNFVIGAQSGSNEILRRCHRGHDVETVIRAARYCKEAGFIPNVDFIFGFPDETEEHQEKTIRVIETLINIGARIHAHYFIPLPGSPWGNKRPAKISEKFRSKIEKLTSSGAIYGVWKDQEDFAMGQRMQKKLAI